MMWGQYAYYPDDEITLDQALTYLPEEHRKRAISQVARLEAMEAARNAKEYVHVSMRANYAKEIFKVMNALIIGIKDYARTAQAIERMDKRRTSIQLQRILERFILPTAYEDLDHPRFYPINPAKWPGYQPNQERINEHGRRVECCHVIDGIPVWIEYDGLNREPSYWICYDPCERYIWSIHYWDPTTAVYKLLQQRKENKKNIKEWESKRYSLEELIKMKRWELYEIARRRGIHIKKSIALLRAEIVQPQATFG